MLGPVYLRIDMLGAGVSTCRLSCFGTVRAQSASTLLEPNGVRHSIQETSAGVKAGGMGLLRGLIKVRTNPT